MNKALVGLGILLTLFGMAVMVVPAFNDKDVTQYSVPTSLVLIVLGVLSVFLARMNHIKAGPVAIEDTPDEPENKPTTEVPKDGTTQV